MSMVFRMFNIFKRKRLPESPKANGKEWLTPEAVHVNVGKLEIKSIDWNRWPVLGFGTEIYFDGVKQDGVRKIVLTIECDSIAIIEMERYA